MISSEASSEHAGAHDDATFLGDFVTEFAGYWQSTGAARTEGLIAGYLLLDETGAVSADELASRLSISRGSVSTGTRRLEAAGFIRRVRRRGERAHYFVMDADVWGSFLRREQRYLANQRDLAERALRRVHPSSPAHERLRNMRDYMRWLHDERRLFTEWERYKAAREQTSID